MQVSLSATLQPAAEGLATIEIEARTIRELLARLVERYPRMSAHMETGIAVSINGEIFRDTWREEIPAGSEVYLLPRLQGG